MNSVLLTVTDVFFIIVVDGVMFLRLQHIFWCSTSVLDNWQQSWLVAPYPTLFHNHLHGQMTSFQQCFGIISKPNFMVSPTPTGTTKVHEFPQKFKDGSRCQLSVFIIHTFLICHVSVISGIKWKTSFKSSFWHYKMAHHPYNSGRES